MYAGPSEDALALFPTRVVPLPEGGSAEAVLAELDRLFRRQLADDRVEQLKAELRQLVGLHAT